MTTYQMTIPAFCSAEVEKDARLICAAKGVDPEYSIERLDTGEAVPAWRFFVAAAEALPGHTGRENPE